jgi:hypothetical protein
MGFQRTIIGAVGIALAMLAAGGSATAAHAAPASVAAPTAQSAAAVSPGISPAAEQIRFVGLFEDYGCRSGRACLAVWDPTRTQYKVFDLYRCGMYSLSYWYDMGTMKNNQTGGAAVRLYDGNGQQIGSPFGWTGEGGLYQFSWDPVWKVKPC